MDLFASFNSFIALALSFALCFFFILRNYRAPNKKIRPPEPAGAWPVIGHLHQLTKGLPHIVLGSLADKYGPIYRVRFGIYSMVVVSSNDLAKELFTTKDSVTSSRPKLIASEILGYNYAMFAFAPYGSYWREVRKMAMSELLSSQRMELLKNVQVVEVEVWLKQLYNLWRKDGADRVLVDMKNWVQDLTMNVILKLVAGKRVFGAVAKGDEEEARRCQEVTRKVMHLFAVYVMRDAVPFLGWLDFGGHEKVMKEAVKEWDNLLSKWIEEHRMKRNEGMKDFMDVMLSLLDGTNLGGYDADTVNKSTCMTMILGGNDSSSTALTWIISLLLNNREVLKNVQKELDINVGKERLVQESDITNLVYLHAVVKEALRLYPPAPLSAPREAIEDCSLGGYHIPKGTRIVVNLWKIQTNPTVWNEPLVFKPERFFETDKSMDMSNRDNNFIPFGGGRRGCPGSPFAMQLVPFVLASVIHAFESSTPLDAIVDMTGSVGLTNMKATPLEVLISPRLSPQLYEM